MTHQANPSWRVILLQNRVHPALAAMADSLPSEIQSDFANWALKHPYALSQASLVAQSLMQQEPAGALGHPRRYITGSSKPPKWVPPATKSNFDSLDDEAKERARNWWREANVDNEYWHESVLEDAERIAEILGIRLNTTHGHRKAIYFSGFSSQGDGACFEGYYSCNPTAVTQIKEYAPKDKELRRIATDLAIIQEKYDCTVTASIRHRGHYYHEHSMEINDVADDEDLITNEDAEGIREALRDFAHWIYKSLEAEYDYQNSDEQVDEAIKANDYEFDEDGNLI